MAAKRATTSIPIVFFAVYAPVEIGLVPNLGHPGGNITGVAVNASDMAGKRVQLFKEFVPTLRRVAMLSHPSHPTNAVQLAGAEAARARWAYSSKPCPCAARTILRPRSKLSAGSTVCCTPIRRSS
jgi:putative ABC transport system substrate-binding protein